MSGKRESQNVCYSDGKRLLTMNLSSGALAKNIFWQVACKVEVGLDAVLEGNLLVKTAVLFESDAIQQTESTTIGTYANIVPLQNDRGRS
jgi:hypothetical protein